jgi:dTDP-4-amino-4,6-dideoxygalactose transaminase
MIPLNDLRRSVNSESESQLRDLTAKVVVSGSYILGSEVRSFEAEFASYLGANFVTSVASGTDALVIALRSLGVERGSKVLVVPNAGGYTTTALMEIGAEPVFVDSDDMGRMDTESLDQFLQSTPEAVCVVATHLYGLDSNIEAVLAAAGLSLADVARVTVCLSDIAHAPTMNEIYARRIGKFRPAREMVATSGLAFGAAIEITVIAYRGRSH